MKGKRKSVGLVSRKPDLQFMSARQRSRIKKCFEKIALTQPLNLVEIIDPDKVSEALLPIIRQQVRSVNVKPPLKC